MMYLHIQMMGFKCMQKIVINKLNGGVGASKGRGLEWVGWVWGIIVRQCKTMCYNGE